MSNLTLSTTFKLVDEMSAKFLDIAKSSDEVIKKFENMGKVSDTSFSSTVNSILDTVKSFNSLDDVTGNYEKSINNVTDNNSSWVKSLDNVDIGLNKQKKSTEESSEVLKNNNEITKDGARNNKEFSEKSIESFKDLSNAINNTGIDKAFKKIVNGFDDCSVATKAFESKISKLKSIMDFKDVSKGFLNIPNNIATNVTKIFSNNNKNKIDLVNDETLRNQENLVKKIIDISDISSELKSAGKKSMSAYISELESGYRKAEQQARAYANNMSNIFGSINTTIKAPTVPKFSPMSLFSGIPKHATGTLSTQKGVALVGEEGPELVTFNGGERVFTAPETRNILHSNEDIFNMTSNENILQNMDSEVVTNTDILQNMDNGVVTNTDILQNMDNGVVTNTDILQNMDNGVVTNTDILQNMDNNVVDMMTNENILQSTLSEETENIFNNNEIIKNKSTDYTLPNPLERNINENRTNTQNNNKTISIEINGNGKIAMEKGMSEESVLNVLYNNIKPVLKNILQQEIFEEGDLSYDY